MKKQKIAYKTEEFEEMKKFVIVLIVVIILIVGIYFISKAVIKNSASLLTYQDGEIETDTIIVGTLLNRPEDEYYVLAYDSTSNQALAYTTYASYYTSEQEKPIKVYYLNLHEEFNQAYYVTEGSNPKATKISDLKIKDGTLIRVKNGKIAEYIEGTEKIAAELKVEEK